MNLELEFHENMFPVYFFVLIILIPHITLYHSNMLHVLLLFKYVLICFRTSEINGFRFINNLEEDMFTV